MLKKFDHGGDVYSRRVELDFSVNLNPLGMPAAVRLALAENVGAFAAYPDPLCRRLRAELAAFLEIPGDWLVFGSGAADLIVRLCLAVRPKNVLVCAPTFSEYEKAALMAEADVWKFSLFEENGFALTEKIFDALDARPEVFFLCNPGNPTGTLAPPETVRALADRCEERGILFVLDECFLSFTDAPSARPLLADHPHLLVVDAFTKMYAVAGLRLGFAISANPVLAARLAAFGQSWGVSAPAQIAGVAALSCGREWLDRTRAFTAEENAFLRAGLRGLGLKVFDGAANYTLFKSPVPLAAALLREGILIRSCANYAGLDETFYRVGVKRRAENERLLAALRGILKKEGA